MILEQLQQAAKQNADNAERLLYDAWIAGEITVTGHDANFEAYKLLNRTENHQYEYPLLTFDIERHGATVNGSVYAEVHTWRVNTQTGQAEIVANRKRQVNPKAPKLDTARLATELALIIREQRPDPRVSWKGPNAKINIGETIPATNQMTTSARRRRFRTALQTILPEWNISRGWKLTKMQGGQGV